MYSYRVTGGNGQDLWELQVMIDGELDCTFRISQIQNWGGDENAAFERYAPDGTHLKTFRVMLAGWNERDIVRTLETHIYGIVIDSMQECK